MAELEGFFEFQGCFKRFNLKKIQQIITSYYYL